MSAAFKHAIVGAFSMIGLISLTGSSSAMPVTPMTPALESAFSASNPVVQEVRWHRRVVRHHRRVWHRHHRR